MKIGTVLGKLPHSGPALVILSGGMDSAIAARLCTEKYGSENVSALSFFYNQKQSLELDRATAIATHLGIRHEQVSLGFLGPMVASVSANVRDGLQMPTIKEVLGHPNPPTEVPFRNSIFLMIAAAYGQTHQIPTIVIGVQSQDQYSYYDTTPTFIGKINQVLELNRSHQIRVVAPWSGLSKADEIAALIEMDGHTDLMGLTLTCYNPSEEGLSCGICPSCAERIAQCKRAGVQDPIGYQIQIDW